MNTFFEARLFKWLQRSLISCRVSPGQELSVHWMCTDCTPVPVMFIDGMEDKEQKLSLLSRPHPVLV